MSDVTGATIAAVGEDRPDADWKLEPQAHIATLANPGKAACLVRILERQEIADIVRRFCGCDAVAIKAQARYKRWGRLGIFATMAATLVGATLLLPVQNWPYFAEVKGSGLLLQYGALILAYFAGWRLLQDKAFADWQEHRGAAELARVELFDRVMRTNEPVQERELPLLPLKLEYFRRFQHDVQRRYYKGRGAQHARGAMRSRSWRWFSWIAYGVVALIGIPSALVWLHDLGWLPLPAFVAFLKHFPVLESLTKAADRSLLAVGIMASAIHAANDARTRMDMDERNAARYAMTFDNLEFLSGTELDNARQSAVAGDAAAVLRFIERVQDQISTEHQQWVLLRKATGKVVV